MSEILKPLKMVVCSSREIVQLQIFFNLPGFQFFTADRMSIGSPPSSNGWTIHSTVWTQDNFQVNTPVDLQAAHEVDDDEYYTDDDDQQQNKDKTRAGTAVSTKH